MRPLSSLLGYNNFNWRTDLVLQQKYIAPSLVATDG